MNDQIIELAIQAMAESCAHFGEDIPTQAEQDELYSDEESKWFFKRFAELVRADALEEAAKVAEDDDHIVDVPGYYAQLGDAKLTAHNIVTAIRELMK